MIIDVKVVTNSSKSGVIKKDDILLIKVHSSPEKGKANKEVVALLSKHFHCSKSCIEILRGVNNNRKVIQIEG